VAPGPVPTPARQPRLRRHAVADGAPAGHPLPGRLLMSRLASWLLAAAVAAPTVAAAGESGLRLHPIPGLFGPEDSTCGTSGRTDNLISPALCDKLAPLERRQYWGQRFDALI